MNMGWINLSQKVIVWHHKASYTEKGAVRIYHEFVEEIYKSVLRLTVWHHKLRRVMINNAPLDRFV